MGDSFRRETGNKVTVGILNATTWERRTLGDYDGSAEALSVSPDGKHIAVASNSDKKIRLWNVQNGQIQTLGENIYPRGLAFTSDSKQLISSGLDPVRIWTVENRQMRVLDKCESDHLAVSPDGNNVIVECSSDEGLTLLNTQTNAKRILLRPGRQIWRAVFSPDNKTLAFTVSDNRQNTVPEERIIRLLNIQTGDIKVLGECEADVSTLMFSRNGKQLASGDNAGKVRIWGMESGQMRVAGTCEQNPVMSVTFSPDGKGLAAACNYDGLYILQL